MLLRRKARFGKLVLPHRPTRMSGFNIHVLEGLEMIYTSSVEIRHTRLNPLNGVVEAHWGWSLRLRVWASLDDGSTNSVIMPLNLELFEPTLFMLADRLMGFHSEILTVVNAITWTNGEVHMSAPLTLMRLRQEEQAEAYFTKVVDVFSALAE